MLARSRRAVAAIVAGLTTAIPGATLVALAQHEPPAAIDVPTDARSAYEKDKALTGQLLRSGNLHEAVQAAARTAIAAETIFGPDSIETAVSLHNHGFVLKRSNQTDAARAALERALVLYERHLPAVHEDSRNAVGELSQIYVKAGRADEASAIYTRLLARAGAEGFGEHVGVAHLLANQGFLLVGLNRPAEGEAAFERAIALYESNHALTTEPYRQTLEALLDRLATTKREPEAAAKARSAIEKLAALGAPGIPLSVALHDRLSRAALDAGRNAEARTEAETALSLIEDAGAAFPRPQPGRLDPTVAALNNLARAHRAEANFPGAEAAYRRAIAQLEAAGDRVNAGIVTDNLAVLYLSQDRHDDAERHHKQALALLEAALGREHTNVGRVAGNLGTLLGEAGRHAEAEPLLRRALTIAETQPAPDKVSIAILEDNLAGVLRMNGRRDEARSHYQRALALFEAVLPPKHPRLATTHNNLGRFLLDLGEHAQAETELTRALAMTEEIYGPERFEIAVPAANLAEVFAATERRSAARALFARALSALEATYGPRHAKLVVTLNAAGQLEIADARPIAARALFERAAQIAVQERKRSADGGSGARGARHEARRAFVGLMNALWDEDTLAGRDTRRDLREAPPRALEVAQWDSMTSSAVALAALGARAGAGDPVLERVTRERQDLSAEWQATDKRLIRLLSQSGDRDTAREAALRTRLAAIEERLTGIDLDLRQRFPRHQELARPSPLSIESLQQLVSPSEAAIQFVVTAESTYVLAVTQRKIRWFRAPIRERELTSLVRGLRCGLDRTEWDGKGLQRCTKLLGQDLTAAPGPSDPIPFDLTAAHNLYRILLAPLDDVLAGKDLLVVASGPLTSLPLQVLVTDLPVAAEGQKAERVLSTNVTSLNRVAWLGRRHAITVLPSLASLGPLRQFARASTARSPYLGIGNPLLTGPDGNDRRAFDVPACAITAEPRPLGAPVVTAAPGRKSRPATSIAVRGTAGGAALLRRQIPLPETALELCRVANDAGAAPSDVLTGAAATETRIRALSSSGRLADARVVHFATHGLLAGETALFVANNAEPSLMLTPPDIATEQDDGLLMASEIATLKLDADWVILSACNTASGDELGAEALSGLARAFFYAGARSLLVSHWAVDSDSTVSLVTAVFQAMARDPQLTQGQALSKAMATLIDGGGREAHPANWAPFEVVGGNAPVIQSVALPEPRLAISPPNKAATEKAAIKRASLRGVKTKASGPRVPSRRKPAGAGTSPALGAVPQATENIWSASRSGQ